MQKLFFFLFCCTLWLCLSVQAIFPHGNAYSDTNLLFYGQDKEIPDGRLSTEQCCSVVNPAGTAVMTALTTRADGAVQIVSSTSASIQNPAFSPDGSAIIYTLFHQGYNAGPAGVYSCPSSGGTCISLIDENGHDSVNLPGMSWNPGTNLITFASDRAGPDDIWTMAGDGSNLTQVTDHTSPGYYIEPSFSPDGQWIVFEADTDAPDDLQQGSIFKISSDGTGGVVKLTDGPAGGTDDRQPNWSPTGSSILFQRRIPGTH
jgi:TolB protein